MEKNQFDQLLERFFHNKTSLDEELFLLNQLREEKGREITAFMEEKWKQAVQMPPLPMDMQRAVWMRVQSKLHHQEGVTSVARANRQPHFDLHISAWIRYVAVAVLTILLSVSGMYLYETGKTAKDYVVIADRGQRASVVLPDGTKVWLNSGSKLTYTNKYGNEERKVSLSGEGYFEVAKDLEHRFLVETAGLEVEALGTVFNVKAYNDENEVTSTLFEGKIRNSDAYGNSVLLSPGQSVVYNKAEQAMEIREDESLLYASAWRDNSMAFDNATLEEVVKNIERIYNIDIIIESEEIRQTRFSGILKNNSLSNILEIISLTAPIRYEVQGSQVILMAR